jgi:HEAT repeat protein
LSIPDFTELVSENWSRAVMRASHELQAFRPQLLAALASTDPELRSAAVATLFEADAADAHDEILVLLDDPVASVRVEAAEYLSEFAGDGDFPQLVARLDDEHMRFHLTKALCRLTGSSDGLLAGDEPEDVTRTVIARWRQWADWHE